MKRISHVLLLTLFVCVSIIPVEAFSQSSQKSDTKETSQKFAAALFYIENFYVDSTQAPKLVESAIVSMLKDLDPHSAYLSKEEIDAANEPLEGSFDGIGVTFQLHKDTILIISPVPGGPSEKLGIQAGDKIIKIDGEEAFGTKVNNKFVMDRLRGKKGSIVNVSIFRSGRKDLIDYAIVRDKIPINSIDATFMLPGKIGYIKLNRFSKTSMEEFQASMAQLKTEGMEGLILDLRGNSGGYLNTAVELSDEFLEAGKMIVYTEGLNSPRQEFKATQKGVFEKGKLVVLINEASASASEIVSGAVQDWDRGLVLGRRSFGKGLVQRPFQLPDGSVIRLTSARYYTPTGRSIQRPYDDGVESYYKDLYERHRRGELVHADSIHFPDSLKYTTPANRIVFGGGGIMPDVFVPWDSTQFTDYYSNLIRKGVFNRFSLEYTNSNRGRLKKTYPKASDFKSNFEVDEKLMTAFLEIAKDEKVEYNEEQFIKSEIIIKHQIKALIARNMWDMSAYYEIMNEIDETLLKALEILNKEDIFSYLKLP
ncbi:MAG: S41 family peptidase [Bacteroidales bacterium]|jgi:carboxyl-terminal processing protease|nr:S41 family peptidase [Bacteroidales bacterium]MDP2235068.1 S41 family peptidase [Bacteroidales bacterium]